MVQLSHLYMTIGKTITLIICIFVGRVMSLLFIMLSRFVIAFLPRSEHLLISWLQLPSTVILEPKKIESVIASTFSPSIFFLSDDTRHHDPSFLNTEFQASFSLSSFTSSRGFLVPLHFLPLE